MKENRAMRVAFGDALIDLGKKNKDVVVLDADISKNTNGWRFKQEFPDRHFEFGIAEQSMMSAGAGFAIGGKIAFVNTLAIFLALRAVDQFRQTTCVCNLNVKVGATSAGLSDYGDGSSHQCIEDISLMRSFPNLTILVPADAEQCYQMVEAAAKHQGPVYMRINRNEVPLVTDETEKFEIGKVYKMTEGKDVAIFATGIMVKKALDAADILAKEGIKARVLNVPTIKPLDEEAVRKYASDVKGVVTAEEGTVVGGFGSAICEALRLEKTPVEMVGIEDQFGTCSLDYDSLLEYYGLTAEHIAEKARKFVK